MMEFVRTTFRWLFSPLLLAWEFCLLVLLSPLFLVLWVFDVVRFLRFKRRLRCAGRIVGWNEAASSLQEGSGCLLVEFFDIKQLSGFVWYVSGGLQEMQHHSLPHYVTFEDRVCNEQRVTFSAEARQWCTAHLRNLVDNARFVEIRWPQDIDTLLASPDVPTSAVFLVPMLGNHY